MKKLITILILAFAALVLTSAQAVPDSDSAAAAASRQAMVEWVQQNAQEALSIAQASLIVDATYWQAQQQALDPGLVLAVMKVESGFRAHAHGRGSKGLMQVQTYWHRDKLKGRSPFDPRVSIEVGTQILGDCWRRHPLDLRGTLRCYNGGGDPRYVRKVAVQQNAANQYARQSVLDLFLVKYNPLTEDRINP